MCIRSIAPILLVCCVSLAAQQVDSARESTRQRALDPYKLGLEQMRTADYDGAAKSFQAAIGIDENFELAHYMLGRAYLAQKRYRPAVVSLTTARNLYLAETTRGFGNEVARRQGAKVPLVPAFVSLSLGSAQLRAGNLKEAEVAYNEAIAADPRTGEAYNNLAVIYLQTGRYAEAEQAVKNAEKTGLAVSQALRDEITKRKGGGPS